jgi:hypothetical protein
MKNYYYVSGRKVELEIDDEHVAVDRAVAQAAGLTGVGGGGGGGMPDLRSGVVLSVKSSLDDKVLEALQGAGALRPVFRHDQAVLVALPEVRVEYDDLTQRNAVKKLLASNFHDAAISEETSDRLTLKPRSGDAHDALKMANEIFEHAHPAASSVRFVQFIPKPSVRR